MKLGVFSVSLPEYEPEEALKVLKELGYDTVEWRVTDPVPMDFLPKEIPFEFRYWGNNKATIPISTIEEQAASLKALSDQYGVEIASLTTYLKPNQLTEVESVLKAAASIGVKKIRVFQDNYPSKEAPTDYRTALSETKAFVSKMELMAKKYGVKILLELHHGTLLSSPSSAFNLLAGFDPAYIGVIVDPGNMVYEGYEDYAKMFELLGSYIGHIHVKNARLVEDGYDEYGSKKWKQCWAPLWEGQANLRELFRCMKKYGYDDTVSVEDFSNEEETYDKLKHNIEYIKKLAASV